MEFKKIRGGFLWTPIISLKSTVGGKTKRVIFVGTCHVAFPAYYDNLRGYISTLEERGYCVVHEESGNDGSRLLPKTKKVECWKQVALLEKPLLERAFALGKLQQQDIGLPVKPGWINGDNMMPLIRHIFRYRTLSDMRDAVRKMRREVKRELALADHVFLFLFLRKRLDSVETKELSRKRKLRPVFWRKVIQDRDAHILKILDLTLVTHHKAIVLFGSMHGPGVIAGLQERGFVIQCVRWKKALPSDANAFANTVRR